MIKRLDILTLSLGMLLTAGCTGEIRETTTARTATHQLLVSEAAARAVKKFEPQTKQILSKKRVAIDDAKFDSIDKNYAMSALRNMLARNQVLIVPAAPQKVKIGDKETMRGPDYILEVRSGALGIKDSDFGLGIPPLPLPIPQSSLVTKSPGFYLFYRDKQEGWAKFQFWIYEPKTKTYLAQSENLWGKTYYTQWTFFAIGPFDFSEDIYPEESLMEGFK